MLSEIRLVFSAGYRQQCHGDVKRKAGEWWLRSADVVVFGQRLKISS
jgi:hypothetical protein